MNPIDYGFWSLMPALATIVVAFAFRKVTWALFLGVVVGAFISAPSLIAFPKELLHYIILCFSNFERNMIILFILAVGILLEVLRVSGAFERFAEFMIRYLDKPKKTRLATFFISLFIFFDDYANILITSTSIRSIAAKQRIPKVYLAYLIDNTATIVSGTIVSTWAAYEGSLMIAAGKPLGLAMSSTEYLVSMLPYNLFIYLVVFTAFMTAFSGRWFGHRMKAGNAAVVEEPIKEINPSITYKTFLIPIVMLIVLSVGGTFAAGLIALKLQGINDYNIVDIVGEAPTIEVLLGATIFTTIYAAWGLFRHKVINIRKFLKASKVGVWGMLPTALIIVWATGLTEVSTALDTGGYIVNLLEPYVTASMIPSMVFVMALLISVFTGFCWSSMAITMPIAFGMAASIGGGGEMIFIVSGAVIGGSIAGDLMIPYSDIIILASTSLDIDPINHIKAHFWQVFAVAMVSVVGFWALAIGMPPILAFICGAGILIGLHSIFAKTI